MESSTENCTVLCKSCLTGTLQTKNKNFVNGIREMATNSSSERYPGSPSIRYLFSKQAIEFHEMEISLDSGLIIVILIIWVLVLIFGYREINELMDFRGDIQLYFGSERFCPFTFFMTIFLTRIQSRKCAR